MIYKEYREEEWFIMHHRDNCTICGRPFIKGMNTYIGKTESNQLAYVCEDCNNLLLSSHFYTNSPGGKNIVPEPQTKLWRYMDLAKFLSLLENKYLYCTRLDHFSDPYECSLGDKCNEELWYKSELERRKMMLSRVANVTDEELTIVAKRKIENFRNNIAHYRKKIYANCWHQSDFESEAMWKLYSNNGKEGIAIQTTFEKLYWSIKEYPINTIVYYGLVNYIDFKEYNKGIPCDKTFHLFDAPWYKRKSFEHEKEFRILLESPLSLSPDYNKKLYVDINSLIDTIYLSPQSEDWFLDLIKKLRSRYKLSFDIKRSELNNLPFY